MPFPSPLLVRPRQVLAEMENYLRFWERILGLSSVSLPLPFRQDSGGRANLQSRQVSFRFAYTRFFLTFTVIQWSWQPSRRSYPHSSSTPLPPLPLPVSVCSSKESPKIHSFSCTTFTRLAPSEISSPSFIDIYRREGFISRIPGSPNPTHR